MSEKLRLAAVRVNCDKSQKEWAEIIGVSVGTVVNWEKGLTEPTLSQLRQMADISGLPIDSFIIGKNNE